MEGVFLNGSDYDKRDILIKINNEHIEFFFYEQYVNRLEWVRDRTEKYENEGWEELDDEEKEINGFYWIGVDEWVNDKTNRLDRGDNWHRHMKRKNWFTKEMAEFINKNTGGVSKKITFKQWYIKIFKSTDESFNQMMDETSEYSVVNMIDLFDAYKRYLANYF